MAQCRTLLLPLAGQHASCSTLKQKQPFPSHSARCSPALPYCTAVYRTASTLRQTMHYYWVTQLPLLLLLHCCCLLLVRVPRSFLV